MNSPFVPLRRKYSVKCGCYHYFFIKIYEQYDKMHDFGGEMNYFAQKLRQIGQNRFQALESPLL